MGICPRCSVRTLAASLSTQTTSLPFSAKHAPATRPDIPAPDDRDFHPCQSSSDHTKPLTPSTAAKNAVNLLTQRSCSLVHAAVLAMSARVRILLDYRPALRQRTGVGEYAHELATALVRAPGRPATSLTLFSSSWKDRLARGRVPGAPVVDRADPGPGAEPRLAPAGVAAGRVACRAASTSPTRCTRC